MSAGPVAAGFNDYRDSVLPRDAPPIQVRECRFAFYAGAWWLLQSVMAGLSPDADVTPADEAFVRAIHAELQEFGMGGSGELPREPGN